MPSTQKLRVTCLRRVYGSMANIVPFAGFEMAGDFGSVVREHQAVRERAGMFDISHMIRIWLIGPEAGALLDYLCTLRISTLGIGQSTYTFMCNPDGGVMDDVMVFRVSEDRFLLVANAANAEKILNWVRQHAQDKKVRVFNRHTSAMIAVQGPQAVDYLAQVVGDSVRSIEPRGCIEIQWEGSTLTVSNSGYTGEEGREVSCRARAGRKLWRRLRELGVVPCGLGSRNTCRIDVPLLLYGHEMTEATNPLELVPICNWVIDLEREDDFVGKEALLKLQEMGITQRLVCLRSESRQKFEGSPILHGGNEVGTVTSSSFSPTLGVSIGLGFVPLELAKEGTELVVMGGKNQDKPLTVRVVKRPFYKRPKKNAA